MKDKTAKVWMGFLEVGDEFCFNGSDYRVEKKDREPIRNSRILNTINLETGEKREFYIRRDSDLTADKYLA